MPGSAATCSSGASRDTLRKPVTTSARRSALPWASKLPSRGAGGGVALSAPPPETRDQHSNAGTVTPIIVTEQRRQVALLVADGDQHERRHAGREQEMPGGHLGRGPECEEKACVERVRNPAIEQGLPQLGVGRLPPTYVEPRLLKAEQFKMVDEEGAQQHDSPTGPEGQPDKVGGERIGDAPHHLRNGSPAEEKNHQRDACSEDVHAALGGPRDELGPPALETPPRHHAVLESEQGDPGQIDDGRDRDGILRPDIDRSAGKWKVADEDDQVEEGREEDRVGNDREK